MNGFADGTMPGTERRPDYGLRAELDAATEQRDRLLDLIEGLVDIMPNGYMPSDHQDILRAARVALVEFGRR